MKLIYHAGGDDYCVGVLVDKTSEIPAASAFAERRLPRRALALSPRYAVGYAERRRDWSGMLRRVWEKALTDIPANVELLEAAIVELVGGKATVIIDMPRKSALKENPEIYVRRTHDKIEEIGRHFDAAQFSAAYENVKKTIWVFSDHPNLAHVAAASALTFMTKLGIVPNDEGLIAAKIDTSEFSKALDLLAGVRAELALAVGELRRVRGDTLRLPIRMLTPMLAIGDENENAQAAAILAEALSDSGLTKQSIDDLDAALTAVRWLLEHSDKTAHTVGRHHPVHG